MNRMAKDSIAKRRGDLLQHGTTAAVAFCLHGGIQNRAVSPFFQVIVEGEDQ